MALAELASGFLEWAQVTVGDWGYLGLFLINFIGSATIILPTPAFVVVFAMGAVLNPWLIGIVSGAGAALGELTGYAIGVGIKEVSEEVRGEKKHGKWLKRAEKWAQKHGIFPVLILFAATPLPDDILGILGGAINYPLKRFLLASFIGKAIMNMALAWGGLYGIGWVLQVFGGIGW